MSQLNVDSIRNRTGTGAPSFPSGVTVTGIVTATSFSGDGSALTNISASQFVTTAAGIHTLSNVGIGTTNPTSKLTVTGNGIFTGVVTATTFVGAVTGNATGLSGTPNITVGTITATSAIVGSAVTINSSGINVTGVVTATDFDSLSDINYKKNVATVDSALSKVDQLRGVKFDWKESGLPSYGVIAQELQEVLPELVHGNDPKTVNYNGIIGVLIEAIKELKAEVEEFKGQLNK